MHHGSKVGLASTVLGLTFVFSALFSPGIGSPVVGLSLVGGFSLFAFGVVELRRSDEFSTDPETGNLGMAAVVTLTVMSFVTGAAVWVV